MLSGISDIEIEKIIEKSRDDLKQNFAGVFTSKDLDCFLRFCSLMKKMLSFLFIIINTDRSGNTLHTRVEHFRFAWEEVNFSF